jgi:hypothetical protein
MPSIRMILTTAAIVIVTLAVVNRVPALKSLTG